MRHITLILTLWLVGCFPDRSDPRDANGSGSDATLTPGGPSEDAAAQGGSPGMGGEAAPGGTSMMAGSPETGGASMMAGSPETGGASMMAGAPETGGTPMPGGSPGQGGVPDMGGTLSMGGAPAMGGQAVPCAAQECVGERPIFPCENGPTDAVCGPDENGVCAWQPPCAPCDDADRDGLCDAIDLACTLPAATPACGDGPPLCEIDSVPMALGACVLDSCVSWADCAALFEDNREARNHTLCWHACGLRQICGGGDAARCTGLCMAEYRETPDLFGARRPCLRAATQRGVCEVVGCFESAVYGACTADADCEAGQFCGQRCFLGLCAEPDEGGDPARQGSCQPCEICAEPMMGLEGCGICAEAAACERDQDCPPAIDAPDGCRQMCVQGLCIEECGGNAAPEQECATVCEHLVDCGIFDPGCAEACLRYSAHSPEAHAQVVACSAAHLLGEPCDEAAFFMCLPPID